MARRSSTKTPEVKPKNEGAVEVRKFAPLQKGKPDRIATSSTMRSKVAFGDTMQGAGGNFYSPELSTDFLELPQSLDEKRNYYRLFYRTNGFVHGTINFLTEMPLTKVRLQPAKAANKALARKATRFCEKWADEVDLLSRLLEILHELHLQGDAFVFAEDASPDPPEDLLQEWMEESYDEGTQGYWKAREDAQERLVDWMKKNYRGWTALRVLPPEQVDMQSFSFTDEKIFALVPDSATKAIVDQAMMGDPDAIRITESMPVSVVEAITNGKNIPLGTDPDAGSFVYHLARKKCQYEPRGISIIEPLLRSLVYRDKLRQAQTSIASRHMTPYRIISAENLNGDQLDELRDQVDLALMDPDFSVITNYQLNWDERGAEQRLLNLDGEYEVTNRELYAGAGVTEGLLTGESSYGGEKISIEVVNQRFMLIRGVICRYVDRYLLKPMCARMGFVEVDEDGREEVIYPHLSFTRLSVRDNQDTFDTLFNLYQKGSLDIDTIYEHLNLDPDTVKEKLRRDMFSVEDSTFNELIRAIYSRVGDMMAESSNVAQLIAENQGWDYNPPPKEEASRFASLKKKAKREKKAAQRILGKVVKKVPDDPLISIRASELEEIIASAVQKALAAKTD